MIQAVLLVNNQIIIAQVYKVDADPGDPNCRLLDPYLFVLGGSRNPGFKLIPWMDEVAEDNYAMMHPDKIITMRDPNPEILELYKKNVLLTQNGEDDIFLDDQDAEVFMEDLED